MKKSIENLTATTYTEKFNACKKSWIRGSIAGVILGIAGALFFSGGKLNSDFWGMGAVTMISSILVIATFLGTKYTAGFGLSCIPRVFEIKRSDVGKMFEYGLLRAGLGATFMGIKMFLYVLALMFFVFAFPIETIYYLIRASIEKKNDNVTMNEMNVAA